MANDGKIYITISDKRFGQNVAEADAQNQIDKEKNKKDTNAFDNFAKHRFFNLVQQQAAQAVNYTVSNIGNFTGDYVAQAQVNNVMETIGFLESLAVSAIAGAKMGGGWGALIAIGVTVTGKGINKGYEIYSGTLSNYRQNKAIEQLRTRAGLNSANNGSRGTEY